MAELKDCPFCGGRASRGIGAIDECENPHYFYELCGMDNPVKSPEVCERCQYSRELCGFPKNCGNCKQLGLSTIDTPAGKYKVAECCRCDLIKDGEICFHYREVEQ